ncbi:MAG: hypothetical protein AAF720_04575 [Pseudomonadota bacterium]
MKAQELIELLKVVDTKLTADMARLASFNQRRRDLETHARNLREQSGQYLVLDSNTLDPIDFVLANNAREARQASAAHFDQQAQTLHPAIETAKSAVRKNLAKKDVIETLLAEADAARKKAV